jgi:Domain of unknown function (DUF4314)
MEAGMPTDKLQGKRIRLIGSNDPYVYRKFGDGGPEGTCIGVDSLGTVHVQWDDGSTLGLLPDEDRWEVL